MIAEADRNKAYVRVIEEDLEHGRAVVEIKNKSINGEPDPEPTQLDLTLAKLALLPSLEDPTHDYVILKLLGQQVAWQKTISDEGAFAGTDEEYTDPKVVRSQVSQGSVEARYIDDSIAIFARRDFMTGNVRADDEELVTLTPESILTLSTMSELDIKTREASTDDIYFYHIYSVFGHKIAFEESRYIEDLAYGRAVDINGPYLIKE